MFSTFSNKCEMANDESWSEWGWTRGGGSEGGIYWELSVGWFWCERERAHSSRVVKFYDVGNFSHDFSFVELPISSAHTHNSYDWTS